MKPVWVKAWEPKDLPKATEWLMDTEQNMYDPSVLLYPATGVLKAYSDEKDILFCPVQDCFLLDALGFAPDATPLERAAALKSLIVALAYESQKQGKREIYFGCKEPSTVSFATHNGFEELTFKMFRMKLK